MTISLVEEKKTCENSDAISINIKEQQQKEGPKRKEIKEKGGKNQEEIK